MPMARTLLKPTIFDKKGEAYRKANKVFASKTKSNIDDYSLRKSHLIDAGDKIKIEISTEDFKTVEEIKEAKETKKTYKYDSIIKEITNG